MAKKPALRAATVALLAALSAAPAFAQQQQQANVPPPTPEQIEALRREINDRAAAEFASPEEIEALRQRQLEEERARAVTGYTNDTARQSMSRRIDLIGGGKAEPYMPQTLNLWSDTVTSLSFFDHQGEAWPVESASFDKRALRVNNDGCDGGSAARLEGMGNVLTLMPCQFWTTTTMQVLLQGETRPMMFDIRSGSSSPNPVVDAAVTVSVQSDVPSPYGTTRAGELANNWINPSARAIRIDPIDTRTDRSVTPIIVGPGVTTDVSFMDSSQTPWPIEEVVFPSGVIAINGACGEIETGLQRIDLKESSTFYMTACNNHRGTIGVKLKGRAGAISLMTVPALPRQSQPDGTVTVTVPGVSPQERPMTVATAAAPGSRGGAGQAAYNPDRYLDDFLAGSPPQGARRASISGGSGIAEGWFFDGALYLRGSFEIVNPAYDAGGSSSDGSFRVFKYGPPVGRILAVDLRGREFVMNIE